METLIAENDSTSHSMPVEAPKRWRQASVRTGLVRDSALVNPEMPGMDIAQVPDAQLGHAYHPEGLRDELRVGQQLLELQAELRKAKKALALKSMYDPLTGALNQGAIVDALHKELIRAGRRTTSTLSIGLCDLDHFRRVNDRYGHQVGDEILRGVASTLRGVLRAYDYVGRCGGEEFLVVVPDSIGSAQEGIYERLRRHIAGYRVKVGSIEVGITMSIGVANLEDGTTSDTIISAADAALHRAKQGGRDRVCYSTAPSLNRDRDPAASCG